MHAISRHARARTLDTRLRCARAAARVKFENAPAALRGLNNERLVDLNNYYIGHKRTTLARMPASVASAESTVAFAAAQEGLPDAATALFDPPLLLLPFRASELPPEVKHKTDQLVESNMRAIYEASGWSEENEAPEGANGEVLYLLLFQHHQEHPGAIATDSAKQEQTPDSQDDDVKHMAAIADGIIGFVAAEFSVEGDKPALYIVELQLAPKVRRRGLGAKLTAAAVS